MKRPKTVLRIAVIADLHAHDTDTDRAPSYLDIREAEDSTSAHPIKTLIDLIKEEELTADILICAGDLADKAKPDAIQYAWKATERIQKALKAKQYIATAGNHDVDSRHQHNAFDAKGFLQQLKPLFPINTERDFHRFWSRHFAIKNHRHGNDVVRFVTLNSAAFHGESFTEDGTPEYEHGRISDWTLDALKKELQKESANLNILVCHHPPQHHSDYGLGEEDTMKNGPQLLNLLESNGYWFVIHGHKHHPKISTAVAQANQPAIIFAAGSLTAMPWDHIAGISRNQFYILEFPLLLIRKMGLVGRFYAWDWLSPFGWKRASEDSGLPHKGGFGSQERPLVLANKIFNAFQSSKYEWKDLCKDHPEIEFLMPLALSELVRILYSDFGITTLRGDDGIKRLER